MRLLLVGEEAAGIQMLRALSAGAHRIVAVMASPPTPGRRGAALWGLAERMGLPTWPAEGVRTPELAQVIRDHEIDLLLNVHSLHVIHDAVLEAPRLGCFNMHPGPLPRYAGLNAVSWALYRGEERHGVTIHRMEPRIDAGPIVAQTCFPIGADDTALSLSLRCVEEGLRLMRSLVARMESDPESIEYAPQDPSEREYFGREVPQQGRVVWERPARAIVDFVRACDYLPFTSPWGHPQTRSRRGQLGLLKAGRTGRPAAAPPGTVTAIADGEAEVATADEAIRISRVEIEGKRADPSDLLRVGEQLDGDD